MFSIRRRRKSMRLFMEGLEQRRLLAAEPIISEFLADNDNTLDDGHGNSSDWIELHNAGDESIDLAGWHLTDDAQNLAKWAFPNFELAAGEYKIVFASGNDSVDPAGNLHTSFSINRDGDYIALVRRDGVTIASEFGHAGAEFPEQFEDVSYGVQVVSGRPHYFPTPTPGSANRVEAINNSGPAIRGVTHQPVQPAASEDFVVTATITSSTEGFASATLTYRVMYGNEFNIEMLDDGIGNDAIAADGVFTATIPAGVYASGEMVRYYVSTLDASDNPARKPEFFRPENSAEYFGTVVRDPDTAATKLPILEWFVEDPNWHREPGGNNRDLSPASIYYDGVFYDNIRVHVRGRTTQNLRKPNFKFDFYSGGHFAYDSDAPKLEELNLQSFMGEIWTKSYMRNPLGYQVYRDSGLAAPNSFYTHVRQNGEFYSLAAIEEEIDSRFLERNGLNTEGALYEANVWPDASLKPNPQESHYRKETREHEGIDDLREFTAGLSLSDPVAREQFVFDNVNIPQVIHYLAVTTLGPNHDRLMHNYYVYRDTGHSDEWSMFPWDLDRWFSQADTLTNPSVRSIFYGDSDHERVNSGIADQYNRLNDAIFDIPTTREMYVAHLRKVVDQFLNTTYFEDSIDAIVDLIQLDAGLDNAKWGIGSLTAGAAAIKGTVRTRRTQLANDSELPPQNSVSQLNLVPAAADARMLVPVDDAHRASWVQTGFDDGLWSRGVTGIGYETLPAEYADLISLDASAALGRNASVYVRIPFQAEDTALIDSLTLRMKYDDGFVAYLNGVEVARSNAPDVLTWNSRAAASRDNSDAIEWQTFSIPQHIGSLRPGENVLAIHGLNVSHRNADLLILPELTAGSQALPSIDFGHIDYNPISGNQDEEFIELLNQSAAAVDISGWELRGGVETTFQPGTVIPANGKLYVSPSVAAFRGRSSGPSGGQGLFVQHYNGHVSSFGETIELVTPNGALVASVETPVDPSAAQQSFRISEVYYNPAAPSAVEVAAGFDDNDFFEFIEFQNTGDETIDLTGVRLSDGVGFVFPAAELAARDFAVVVQNEEAFRFRYGDDPSVVVLGEFSSGGLSDGGERLRLDDAQGATILDFAYGDSDPWPERADGSGASLELVDTDTPVEELGKHYRWRGSTEFGGSPGRAGIEPMGVVVNEVLSNTDAPTTDAIELHNPTDRDMDISGWFLSDSDNDLLKFAIPDGTVLQPGSYVVFDENDFNPNPAEPGPQDFALDGANGDDVWLVISDGAGSVAQFVDDVHFGATTSGETLGRSPNGSGRLTPLGRDTLGCGNWHPRVGPLVLSEIHYNPGEPSAAALAIQSSLDSSDLEFVEIHNPTGQDVSLANWRLRGGVDYDFASDSILAAGETLIVISFNPASIANADRLSAFAAHFGLGLELDRVEIVGGWSGQLSDSGEVVRLERPDQPPPEAPLLTPHVTEDEVLYDDLAPWAAAADGTGSSLHRVAPVFFGNATNSWRGADPTPGQVDFSANLPGDLDGDGSLTADDIDILFDAVHSGSTVSYLDLDGSHTVDSADVTFLVENLLGTSPGDANLDGRVDAADLNQVGLHWLQSGCVSWSSGNLNGDGRVNPGDLNVIGLNWLRGVPAAIAGGGDRTPRAALARQEGAVKPAAEHWRRSHDLLENVAAVDHVLASIMHDGSGHERSFNVVPWRASPQPSALRHTRRADREAVRGSTDPSSDVLNALLQELRFP